MMRTSGMQTLVTGRGREGGFGFHSLHLLFLDFMGYVDNTS